MGVLSYAQNFEDVVLWRALKDVGKGFYIDVGACDPSKDSVTKAFYDKGWSGINVEPVSQHFENLVCERPRDINLQLVLGSKPGTTQFFVVPDTGLSTRSKKIAERHEVESGYAHSETNISVDTLSQVCEKHCNSPIHFLKIDVEGAEKDVIEGLDLGKIRPWIIVVEATSPMSQTLSHESWDHLITSVDYQFVHFDGLNRFYIASEHEELREHFDLPPNVFDEFQLAKDQTFSLLLTREIDEANHKLAEYGARIDQANQELAEHREQIELLNRSLQLWRFRAQTHEDKARELLNSLSWKITRPLRLLLDLVVDVFKLPQPVKATVEAAPVPLQTKKSAPLQLTPRATRIFDQLEQKTDKRRRH